MASIDGFPQAPALQTQRLILEPLWLDHAEEMAPLLADPRLHEFTRGEPPSLEYLRESYRARLSAGASGASRWCNWILRLREPAVVVGGVQAQVTLGDEGFRAEISWIVGCEHQRRGYAREAAEAMLTWLRAVGVRHVVGDIHERNEPSNRLARAVGLAPTDDPTEHEGDVRWRA
jgi:RimJ/RimL family protein N-acetyltransferase